MGCGWEVCKPDHETENLDILFLQPDHKIQAGNHIPQLDGLRGIAIIMVMCYHFFPNNIVCNFGWSGVDLFFVLSGFLISGRLLPYLDDKDIFLKFYRNRFLRIVPLYFAFLILFFAGWFLLSSKQTLAGYTFYREHWWQFYLFIQNWVFANELEAVKTHLQHLWSIAVEEQIYLVFPLFVLLLKNTQKIFYAIIFIIFVIVAARCYHFNIVLHKQEHLKIYLNTFFRLDAFLCGVLIYLLYNERYRLKKGISIITLLGFAGFAGILSFILITGSTEKNNSFINNGGYTLIALMYAALLMSVLLKKNQLINAITSFGFLRYTGRISYGLYIFHWPLFMLGFILLNKLFALLDISPGQNYIHIINILICAPATYLVSHLSFKYFESFFLKKKVSNAKLSH